MVTIISEGNGNLVLVSSFSKDLKVTISTFSQEISLRLTDYPNIDTLQIGGKILKKSMIPAGIVVFRVLINIC